MKTSFFICLLLITMCSSATFSQTKKPVEKNTADVKVKAGQAPHVVIVDAFKNLVADSNKRTACNIEYLSDLQISATESALGKAYTIKKGTIAENGTTTIEKNGDYFKLVSSKMVIGKNLSDKVVNGLRQTEIHYSNFTIVFLEKTGTNAFAFYNDGALVGNISNIKSYKVPNVTGRWQNKYCIEFDANGSRVRLNFFKAVALNDK